MAALKDDAKLFIVQRLACFDTPSQVSKAIKEEMGLIVTPQQAECYNPNRKIGKDLSEKWKRVFEETRKTFLDNTSDIGISHKAVRLRTLQRMAEKAESQGNMVLAATLLEQAAKECGDAFTNKHKVDHTSSDGSMAPKPSVIELVAPGDNGKN